MLGAILLTLGLILLVRVFLEKKNGSSKSNPYSQKKALLIGGAMVLIGFLAMNGSIKKKAEPEIQKATLTMDSGEEVVEKFIVTEVEKSEVDDKYIKDWFETYNKNLEIDAAYLIYKGQDNQKEVEGVYGNNSYVEKDIKLKKEENGYYSIIDGTGATIYQSDVRGNLEKVQL